MMAETTVCEYPKQDNDGIASVKECRTRSDDEKQRKETGLTKTQLMSLANEVFDLFLIYLSPCDIIQSLSGINQRLNSLIYRFVHQMDVSNKTKQWLNKHLPSIQPLLTKLQFDHSQLQTLFPTISNHYPSLQSMIWTYQVGRQDHRSESYLNVFKTQLSSLRIYLNTRIEHEDVTIHNNIILLLLGENSFIEKLTLIDMSKYVPLWFSFKPNTLQVNQHLKHLTIKLHYVHDLFILMEHLSVLEYLNVEVCEIPKKDTYDYTRFETTTAILSPCLKELIIDSLDFSYPRLLLFLKPFKQSIELLTLKMYVKDQIDGEILESTIMKKIPNLKNFQFFLQIGCAENVDINPGMDKLISTFRSTSYWSTRPVMCYHEHICSCFTILSLPWRLKESESVTNEIINYRTNTTGRLQLNNVKTIYLAGTTITLPLLRFINETFVDLKKMIISWFSCELDEAVFHAKNQVKLSTITTLKYYGATDDLEYIDFFLLTPNLRRLIVDGSTIHVINGYVHENEQLASLCTQIKTLNIFRNFSACDEEETEETFPNALVSSKVI